MRNHRDVQAVRERSAPTRSSARDRLIRLERGGDWRATGTHLALKITPLTLHRVERAPDNAELHPVTADQLRFKWRARPALALRLRPWSRSSWSSTDMISRRMSVISASPP